MNSITTDMKFAVVPQWVIGSQISDRAYRVYTLLCMYADNETGAAFPSYRTMADRLGWERQKVRIGVKELQHAGLIECSPQFANGRQTSNLYVVRRSPIDNQQPVNKPVDDGGDTGGGRVVSQPGGVSKRIPPGGSKLIHQELDHNQLDHKNKNVTSDVAVGDLEHDDYSDTVVQLSRVFAQLVKQNGHKLPAKGSKAADQWLTAMDRLLRIGPPGDGVEPVPADEVARVMKWALQESDFWPSVIRSLPNFRAKFSVIASQSLRDQVRHERRQVADDWVGAWTELGLQIRRVGRYGGRPVLPQLLDEYVAGLGGWGKACSTVDVGDTTQRAQFRDWYSAQVERLDGAIDGTPGRVGSAVHDGVRELERVGGKDYWVVPSGDDT